MKKMIGLVILAVFCFTSVYADVFITEIADPNNASSGRFVELYNNGPAEVDLSTGWQLQRYTNGNVEPQGPVDLTGIIPASGFYIICANGVEFSSLYGFEADQDIGTGGPADSNGDDNIQLLDPSAAIIDLFGVPGEDGSGTDHEFEDGRAERADFVTTGNPAWDVAEWNIDNDSGGGDGSQDAPDGFDPGEWIGEGGPSTDPYLSITTPGNGSVINTSDVDIVFAVGNFVVAETGGDGYIQYTLDTGATMNAYTTDPINLTGLSEEVHTVNMWLVDNSELPLDPTVEASVTFTVLLPLNLTIAEIQGGVDSSPYDGMPVITTGIVTGVVYNGIFIQDGTGAWNGIWVYLGDASEFSLGDGVEVTGMCVEYYDLTEIEGAATLLSEENELPDPVALATGDLAEAYEGVLVAFSDATCDATDLGYGEWSVDDGTGTAVIDDKMYAFTPELGINYDVMGVVDFGYGSYKVLPREEADVVVSGGATTVAVTFQVDMQYQEVSEFGVHIAGAFQDWNPGIDECLPVGDDIYAITFDLTPGEYYEYKFINGNAWGSDESVQRNITVPDVDTVLDPVFFDDYEDVGGVPVFVTFNLNTATMPGWTPDINTIVIRGGFNGWSGEEWQVANVGGDYWTFTTPTELEPGNYEYKYVHLGLAGDEWESVDNRQLAVTGNDGDMNLAVDYFNSNISILDETDEIDVLFRVTTDCIPGYALETMYMAGSPNEWGNPAFELTDQYGDGTFWLGTVHLAEAADIEYKFWWDEGGWEGVDNRTASITADTTLGFVHWDDLGPCLEDPVTKTIVFQVDLTEWLDEEGSTGMPIFSLARNDEIQVRGGFNGWNADPPEESVMVRQPGTNTFTLPLTITNYPSQVIEYKFFINHSEESLAYLEGIYGPMYGVDMGWEDSPQFGGSNRTFTLADTGEEDIYLLPLAGYYDLPAGAVIPDDQTINMTMTVDMTSAEADGFAAGDEVRVVLKDKWMSYFQGFGDAVPIPAVDNGDGTYTATIAITGPAPWHQIYNWEFEDVEGTSVQEGGGFGFGRFRARYMCPDDGVWGDWDFPLDIWTIDPPLVVEDYAAALECLGVCIADGDVNADGSLDILDIVEVVGHVLGQYPLDENVSCHADMDNSGTVDILDIVIMIDFILQRDGNTQDATEASIQENDGTVSISGNGLIGGIQMVLHHGKDFAIELSDNVFLADYYTANGTTNLIVLHPENELFTATGEFTIGEITAAAGRSYLDVVIAEDYALLSNYPNPFNPSTRIDYSVPADGVVTVSIYNMIGQRIATLVDDYAKSDNYSVKWNGLTDQGEFVPSGIYFVQMQYSEGQLTQKITLLK